MPAEEELAQLKRELVAGRAKERRQVYDLPEMRLVVWEHHVEVVLCPARGQGNVGSFPAGVWAPAQDGPNVQTLVLSLH